MDKLYARSVFFVSDAERAREFYRDTLGFETDWDYRYEESIFICQVSLFGFELILNEVDNGTEERAGHGRLFIGLEDDQAESLRAHLIALGAPTERREWGRPTLVIQDPDGNELFFWFPGDDLSAFESP